MHATVHFLDLFSVNKCTGHRIDAKSVLTKVHLNSFLKQIKQTQISRCMAIRSSSVQAGTPIFRAGQLFQASPLHSRDVRNATCTTLTDETNMSMEVSMNQATLCKKKCTTCGSSASSYLGPAGLHLWLHQKEYNELLPV